MNDKYFVGNKTKTTEMQHDIGTPLSVNVVPDIDLEETWAKRNIVLQKDTRK